MPGIAMLRLKFERVLTQRGVAVTAVNRNPQERSRPQRNRKRLRSLEQTGVGKVTDYALVLNKNRS